MNTRYFFDQDDSSHWYMIPLDRKEEWDEWVNNGSWEDEFYQEAQKWMIDGPVQMFSFTNPEEI